VFSPCTNFFVTPLFWSFAYQGNMREIAVVKLTLSNQPNIGVTRPTPTVQRSGILTRKGVPAGTYRSASKGCEEQRITSTSYLKDEYFLNGPRSNDLGLPQLK
jgi:hypothetical protein